MLQTSHISNATDSTHGEFDTSTSHFLHFLRKCHSGGYQSVEIHSACTALPPADVETGPSSFFLIITSLSVYVHTIFPLLIGVLRRIIHRHQLHRVRSIGQDRGNQLHHLIIIIFIIVPPNFNLYIPTRKK